MGETARGGVYLAADGQTYVDAFGKPVKGDVVAEAKEIQRQESQIKTATLTTIPSQSNEALAAAMRSLLVPQGNTANVVNTVQPDSKQSESKK